MKRFGIILLLLAVSLTVNLVLWERQRRLAQLSRQNVELNAAVERLQSESDQLRRALAQRPVEAEAQVREIARLRREVSGLRKAAETQPRPITRISARPGGAQSDDAVALYMSATQDLAVVERRYDDIVREANALTEDMSSATPERLDELKRVAQSNKCINQIKQIGLAARIWANDHNDVFPPDFLSMREELAPQNLFCPAAPGVIPVTNWAQVNPANISYHLVNAGGKDDEDPNKVLTTCRFHNNVGLSDGSAQKLRGSPGVP